MSKLVVVDNLSSDKTLDYLTTIPEIQVIKNRQNMGCGVAWNQGTLVHQSEWTVIMNNDILVSQNWINNLIDGAIEHGLRVCSPAMIEGALDYDFLASAENNSAAMTHYARIGSAHAVCLLVHRSVWDEIGYFRPWPKLLGYEDTLFFFDLYKNGIQHATLGKSWIHHFGSITVKSLKEKLGTNRKGGLGRPDNHRLLDQTFFERKWRKFQQVQRIKKQREQELQQFGLTIHGVRANGELFWY